MVCMFCGEFRENLVWGIKLVCVKMDVVVEVIKKENLREEWVKEELVEVNKREEGVLSKKRKIFDEIKEVEKEIEKVEIKESYCKERLYFVL